MAVDAISFPGNTFLDMDCESSSRYEGKIPGTTSISGYSEEYREHQLLRAPLLNLALESTETPTTMPLDKIVERIRAQQQRVATLEDNVALRDILGLSQYV
jgi:DNA primase